MTYSIIFGVLAACCAVFAGFQVRSLVRGKNSAQWPVAPGEVLSSELRTTWYAHGPRYKPTVRYRYQVGGRHIVGGRVAFAVGSLLARDAAQALVDKYVVGSTVSVHYNPDRVVQSVLEPGVRRLGVLDMVLTMGMVGWWVCWAIAAA